MKSIATQLRETGLAIRPAAAMEAWLKWSWSDWARFADSWNNLEEDRYMADGGRYRRRRYAVFEVVDDRVARKSHQPHYQAKAYNRLNGGLERWFEPVTDEIGKHAIVQILIRQLAAIFQSIVQPRGPKLGWHVEMHQFRIEAGADNPGNPTPEGVHRDGVDAVFVMLINRDNVASGVTDTFDSEGHSLGSFTLANPGDAVFLDDRRVFHSVTPIIPLNPLTRAVRDVLVLTYICRI